MTMISVQAARKLIIDQAKLCGVETIAVQNAAGRVNVAPLSALRSQPPADVSAMDGYAVRSKDAVKGESLTVIGEAPAGRPFAGKVKAGQAVRLFTGSFIPGGAQHIVIQEDTARQGDVIKIVNDQNPPRHIRAAGQDFSKGDKLKPEGQRLAALDLSLLAAAGLSTLEVYKRPTVAIFATGSELVDIGLPSNDHDIIASSPATLVNWLRDWGAEPRYLGIAKDNLDSLTAIIEQANEADIIVPLGGASVGDYDLVKSAFETLGYTNLFTKVAVRPGKPVWFGSWNLSCVLGLPGNPGSSFVCAQLFLKPLIEAMTGQKPKAEIKFIRGWLSEAVKANGSRETYLRGHYKFSVTGQIYAAPNARQDSSLTQVSAASNCLIRRAPFATDSPENAPCDIMFLT